MKTRRLNHDTSVQNGSDGTRAQAAPDEESTRNPGDMDFKKAARVAKKLVRDNKEWLKEMAKK